MRLITITGEHRDVDDSNHDNDVTRMRIRPSSDGDYISTCADSVDEFLPLEGAVSAVWKFLGFCS